MVAPSLQSSTGNCGPRPIPTALGKSCFGKLAHLCNNWPVAAGFYTFEQLSLGLPSLSPPARLAVIGLPVAHSRSPQMHNPALQAAGIEAQYVRVEVPIGRVAESFSHFAAQGFFGVNITIPHKLEALQAVEFLDPLAEHLGTVNTLAIRDGRFWGFNTDGPGFLRSLHESLGTSPSGLRIAVLGAGGGAGRAVAIQCALAGCEALTLINRDPTKLPELCAQVRQFAPACSLTCLPHTDETLAQLPAAADLIINATSLGMRESDPHLLEAKQLASHRPLIYDMVYRQGGPTALVAAALQVGCAVADGMELLLHQGALSFEHWFGRPAPLEIMRNALRNLNSSLNSPS